LNTSIINNSVFALSKFQTNGFLLTEWVDDGFYVKSDTVSGDISILKTIGPEVNEYGYVIVTLTATAPTVFDSNIFADCPSENSSAVFALYHDPRFAQPFVPDDTVGIDY
jgi:hypothetical protein